MIISNGFVSYLVLEGSTGSVDELGRPLESTARWSQAIPCRVETTTDTRKGVYEDGKYRHAEFQLLLDHHHQPFPHKRVRIERLGEELGEYDVISVTPLEAVHALRIMVAR